jgi:cytochrome c
MAMHLPHTVAFPVLALVVALGSTAVAAGDPGRGQAIYERCMGCHAIGYEVVGPDHAGLFGRKAGSLPGYDYSPAMRAAGWIWDAATLDRFLANPRGVVPGTKMGFAGVQDPDERADLIAYLQQATAKKAAAQ